jgi:PDZ domain
VIANAMKRQVYYPLIFAAWHLSMPAWSLVRAEEPAATQAAAQPVIESQPASPPPEIANWIAELDDNRYLIREAATQRLLEAGTAALDPLLAAANGDRPEPADRAIWVLQKLARDDRIAVAQPALERLVKLRGRQQLVADSQAELARITLLVCQRKLEGLGAVFNMQWVPVSPLAIFTPVVHVTLGDKWRGKSEDLRPLAEQVYFKHFRLEGAPVDDDVAKLFEAKKDLAFLQFFGTKVSVAAVDSLKERCPDASVYVRNLALLGVQPQINRGVGAGIFVESVRPGTAAAAANLQAGDVILALDGKLLPDFDRLTAHIAQHKPGDKVQIDIQRGPKKLTLEVTLGSWAGQQ